MAKVKLQDLTMAAEELNDVLGIEPAIKIKGAKEEELIKKLMEAAALIDLSQDEISVKTISTLKELGATLEGEEEEKPVKKAGKPTPKKAVVEEDDDEEDDDEEEEKPVKKQVAKPAPKKAVVEEDDDDDNDEEEKPVKKAGKPAPKPVKKVMEKYTRIESVCDALKKKPKTTQEWVDKSGEIMEQHGGKKNPNETRVLINFVIKTLQSFEVEVKIPQ